MTDNNGQPVNGASTTARCQGTNKAGEPCGSWHVGPDGYCNRHTPDRAVQQLMAASSIRGGVAMNARRRRAGLPEHELPPLDSMQAAEQYAAIITHALVTGRLAAYGGKAAISALREFRTAHMAAKQQREFEARIAELETRLAERESGGNGKHS